MMKRCAAGFFAATVLIVLLAFSMTNSSAQSLTCLACGGDSSVVDKAPREVFTVEIAFKNTGKTEGTWTVNIAFEGEAWNWKGTGQNLTLKPYNMKTLTWTGKVPENAPIDSVGRLVVYYDDSFAALNWWIHVVPNAQLAITSSTVK